jgi:hypothetical protein
MTLRDKYFALYEGQRVAEHIRKHRSWRYKVGEPYYAIRCLHLPLPTEDGTLDELREKGYATPFEDMSVNDLIEMGWLKLCSTEA